MALFGSKKNMKEVSPQEGSVSVREPSVPNATLAQSSISNGGSVAHVLKSPRITEKASLQQAMSVYTFDVATSATKTQIISAIRSVYKVTPSKVRIVQIPSKKTRNARTGRTGVKSGGKKAYVYLKNGETISVT